MESMTLESHGGGGCRVELVALNEKSSLRTRLPAATCCRLRWAAIE